MVEDEAIATDALEIGKRYEVIIDDCCVKGEFTATLVVLDLEENKMIFDNGLMLVWWSGLTFYPPEPPALPRA